MSSEKSTITYSTTEHQIEKYIHEMDLVALRDTLQYVLLHYGIYFNIPIKKIAIAYTDYTFSGVIVTFILTNGVAFKVKIIKDKDKDNIVGAEAWCVTD